MQVPRAKTPAQINEGDAARYTRRFYRDVLTVLDRDRVPCLVGGAFAFTRYTGIQRPTKDFDLFLRRCHVDRALAALAASGFHTELTFPHWLGKARSDEFLVDLIFSSGNGVAIVDDQWFEHAVDEEAVGVPVRLCPVEELIWSKSFVMERERYDGSDVIHLLRSNGPTLDWPRLVQRFGDHWRVLHVYLTLRGFVYPGDPCPAPRWVTDDLLARLRREIEASPAGDRLCRGTLLSRSQFLDDLERLGYTDARLKQHGGSMTPDEIALWTAGIEDDV